MTPTAMGVAQMPVKQLKAILDSGDADAYQLVDVREAGELEMASIPAFGGGKHLPLSQANEWAGQVKDHLDSERPVICLCHHGVRSQQVGAFLKDNGFDEVWNVVGGIDAYADIDPSVGRY